MEEKAIKVAAVTLSILMIAACFGMPYLADLHTWAVEREEERLAEAELEEAQMAQMEMLSLEMKNTEVANENEARQLRLTLPEGVDGSEIKIENNYLTQTIRIEIPETDYRYFENYPITGSSNHIDNLS